MSKLQLIILGLLLLGGIISCKTTDIDASSKAATYASNIKDINTYIASQSWTTTPTAVTSNSGLYFALTKASSSTVSPAYGQELEFTYTLSSLTSTVGTSTTTVTAKVVDSTYAKSPVFIPFKKGILRAGLEEGLFLMHEGDKAVLLMPSILAFGDAGSSDNLVAANTPVRYDITLNKARTEEQQIDEYVPTTGLTLTQKTTSGLRFFLTTSNAAGDSVKAAQAKNLTITIKYVGKQLHAKTAVGFDSTSTGLNLYNVSGFTEGLAKLRIGDKATFIFPSSIGYKDTGLVVDKTTGIFKVSPYAPLRYDVEVVSAK